MRDKVLDILDRHDIAAVATNRADGWPQVTLVTYAHDGLTIFAAVSRRSQKFANLTRDPRASLAIGSAAPDPASIRELAIAAHAREVPDEEARARAFALIRARHPQWPLPSGPPPPDTAVIGFTPWLVTVVDFARGLGHADVLTVGAGGLIEMQPARPDDWGFLPSPRREPEIRWR